jgi:protein-L-isoaspartate(D-aspartate) O-methyltransferase
VWSVEVHASLSEAARDALGRAGADNVSLIVGDGSAGLPGEAPFDAINVAAAGPVDRLDGLVQQLAGGGRRVAPVQDSDGEQRLAVIRRFAGGRVRRTDHERVRFVPLVG